MAEKREQREKYHGLGESGILVDEDGNWVDEPWEGNEEVTQTPSTATIAPPSFDTDKSDPAYWAFYYDERYCGPSREAYVERMVKQYAGRPEKSSTPYPPSVATKGTGNETPIDEREFDALVDHYAPSPYQRTPDARPQKKTYWERYAENRKRKLRDWEIALMILTAAVLFVLLLFKFMESA